MQRFFVEPYQIEEEAHRIHINGTDVNHIKNVLRMKCGEDVWISDGGDKEYHCQIEELGEDEVLLHILYAQEPEYELPNKIYLFQGLPKADKMELIIQKAVELGAFSIIPVETKRCVVKLDVKKAAKKVVRWQQIAESAAKQSKRMLIPEIDRPFFLAGGLGADNLETAVRTIHPYAVDLSSSVETDGMKDRDKILKAVQLVHIK